MQPTLVPLPAAPINKSALDLITDLLARIQSGELIDVAVVEVRRDRSVATAWSAGSSYHLLNSGAARLASRLARED